MLDARTRGFRVLQSCPRAAGAHAEDPARHGGDAATATRGEVIGFQVRSIRVEGRDYPWDEYLLFRPPKGFAYLTAYQGHWSFGTTYPGVMRNDGWCLALTVRSVADGSGHPRDG